MDRSSLIGKWLPVLATVSMFGVAFGSLQTAFAQPRTVQQQATEITVKQPPKLRGNSFVWVDQTHQAIQAILNGNLSTQGDFRQTEARRAQATLVLQQLINHYEKVVGLGSRALEIGLLLSDLGEARIDRNQKIRALSAAIPILAAHVGRDTRVDLAYAQAVDRLAEAYLRDRSTTGDRVTPTLMAGLQVLGSRRANAAEGALLSHWSIHTDALQNAGSENSFHIPGFDVLVRHAAAAAEAGRSPCTRFHALEFTQAKKLRLSGKEHEANALVKRSMEAATAAVRSGCEIDWSPQLSEMDDFGLPKQAVASLLVQQIRRHVSENPGEPPRAGEGVIEDMVASLAEVGTLAQLQGALPLLRGNSSIWPNANESLNQADLVAKLARFRWLGGSWGNNPRGAAALFARLPELRPSTLQQGAGGWGRASDLIAAAEFHASAGSRARGTDLARLLAYRFPVGQVNVEERARALLILARNASDEGDPLAAGQILAEVAALPVPGKPDVHLSRVLDLAAQLPPDARASPRAAILTLAAKVIPANLQPRRGNGGAIIPHGFEYIVLQAAELFSDQALFDRVRIGTGAVQEFTHGMLFKAIAEGRKPEAWLLQNASGAKISGSMSSESLGALVPLLLAKDYRGIFERLQKVDDGSIDCDFGSIDMLRFVATERAAGRIPSFPAAETTLNRVHRNLCAGNSTFSINDQEEAWRQTGLFWRAIGEVGVAKAYLDPTSKSAQGIGLEPKRALIQDAINRPQAVFEQLSTAQIRMETGDVRGALTIAESMTDMIAARIRSAGAANDQVRETTRFREPLDLHLHAVAKFGEQAGATIDAPVLTRAFNALQLRRATGAAVAAARLSARLANNDSALATALRERQDASERVELLGRQLQAAEDNAAKSRIASALKAALESQERINRGFAQRFPRISGEDALEPLPLVEAQSRLRAGEALVVSATTRDVVLLFVATRDRAGIIRAGLPRAEIEASLRKLRDGLRVSRGDRFLPRFQTAEARRLHDALIAPLRSMLGGIEHLTIVADGPLESLPFAVLVEGEAVDRPRYLIDRFSLSHLPSVRALIVPTAQTARSELTYLGVGDPVLGPPDVEFPTRGLGRLKPGERASSVKALASLPASRAEIEQVSRRFSAQSAALLLGPEATEARLKRENLSRFRVIHFATHAVVANELHGIPEPGIALTPPEKPEGEDDGLLTATEIGTLNLAADMVILSACNTAASDGRPNAEGLSGLARAFITAGARNLLVSHWAVLSGPTGALMSRFADASVSGISPALAMRKAMLDMLADNANPDNQHPIIWAPFIVVGR